MKKILVIQGPNLNLLGHREPDTYGNVSLESLHHHLEKKASESNLSISFYQSNSESALITKIHQSAKEGIDYIMINPAAFTHTSIALRDALVAVNIPFIEVHISNIYQREPFRRHSYFSDMASGVICGLGIEGYYLALDAIKTKLNKSNL